MQGHFDKSIFKGKSKTSSVKWVFFAGITGYLIGVFFYLMEGNRVFGLEVNTQEPGFIKELLIEMPIKKMDKLVKTITMQQTAFKGHDDKQSQTAVHALVSDVRKLFGGVAKTTTVAWQWKTGKSSTSGSFTYTHKKNIDTKKVCNNYKYGSLIYNDCRKAAKKYFKDMCSSEIPAACRASTMTL